MVGAKPLFRPRWGCMMVTEQGCWQSQAWEEWKWRVSRQSYWKAKREARAETERKRFANVLQHEDQRLKVSSQLNGLWPSLQLSPSRPAVWYLSVFYLRHHVCLCSSWLMMLLHQSSEPLSMSRTASCSSCVICMGGGAFYVERELKWWSGEWMTIPLCLGLHCSICLLRW